MAESTEPPELLSILFVTSGTRGDRLLFRYPFEDQKKPYTIKNQTKNPYAVKVTEDFHRRRDQTVTTKGVLAGLSDMTLANVLGVKSSLCGQKFNVKIEDVRFVGFPVLLNEVPAVKTGHVILSFNIVFTLQANSGPWIVSSYQDIAKQLMVALKHEEKRVQYLSNQAKIMTSVHDEVTTQPEGSMSSPYEIIVQRSKLAKQLKQIFNSLTENGLVHLYINNWVEIHVCLPHKLHAAQLASKTCHMKPESLQKYMQLLRPYHGILLLQEETALLETLPIDCTPALSRLIQVVNPLHSLQTLALEADLSLFQVFQLACHLVYWAKAVIIYPLCETNVYLLSPTADTHASSKLIDEFANEFPGKLLPVELSQFSFPTQLRDTQSVLSSTDPNDMKVRVVVWMLQQRLLIQLHTYIFFVPFIHKQKVKVQEEKSKTQSSDECSSFEGSVHRSLSFTDAAGLQRSPSFSDIASATSDESLSISTPGMLVAQLSKSPSSEFTLDSSLVSEESKVYWMMHESVFANLSQEERECIINVPAAKSLDDLRMFARLFPYFSGKNHIEEIMYFENLRRSQLITLIEKFKDVLILSTYPDPAV